MRILQIVHGAPPSSMGGTELYVEALSRALARQGHDVLVIVRERDAGKHEYAVRRERRGGVDLALVNNTFSACSSFPDAYRNPRLAGVVDGLARAFAPDVAHIHHLTCLSTEIPARLASTGVPMVMTLHDYWLLCHRGQLLDRDLRVCEGPGASGCTSCIGVAMTAGAGVHLAARALRVIGRRAPGLAAQGARLGRRVLRATQSDARLTGLDPARLVSLRRTEDMRAAASHVALFLAPSEYLRQRFLAFGFEPDRIVRHEQGIDVAAFAPRLEAPGPLRIGFFGSLVVSKGPEVLLDAFRQLPAGSAILRVFGNPAPYHDDERSERRLRALLDTPGVEHTGPIPRDCVPGALRELDVVAMPSIWPENGPFVLREACAAGVPVVASRIGGIPEVIRDGVNGLLFEAGNAADCARALAQLSRDRRLIAPSSGTFTVRDLDEDARISLQYYERVRHAARPPRTVPAPARNARRIAAVVLNYHTPDEVVLAVHSLLASDRRPDEVIVVDNDSQDGGAALQGRVVRARVHALAGNRGFSGGMNAGIARALDAGADAVLLLNSDVVVAPDAIGALADALVRTGAGIAGPALLSRSDPGTVSSLGMSWSPRSGRMRHHGFGSPAAALSGRTAEPVDAVTGGAMLVHRELFELCGMLDEDYFFGFEDLDFCLRARRAGFTTICCPEAVVYHEGGRSIGARSPRRVYFATRNHLRLAVREDGDRWRRSLRGAAVLAFNVAYVARAREVPLLAGLAALVRGVRDHVAGRYGAG